MGLPGGTNKQKQKSKNQKIKKAEYGTRKQRREGLDRLLGSRSRLQRGSKVAGEKVGVDRKSDGKVVPEEVGTVAGGKRGREEDAGWSEWWSLAGGLAGWAASVGWCLLWWLWVWLGVQQAKKKQREHEVVGNKKDDGVCLLWGLGSGEGCQLVGLLTEAKGWLWVRLRGQQARKKRQEQEVAGNKKGDGVCLPWGLWSGEGCQLVGLPTEAKAERVPFCLPMAGTAKMVSAGALWCLTGAENAEQSAGWWACLTEAAEQGHLPLVVGATTEARGVPRGTPVWQVQGTSWRAGPAEAFRMEQVPETVAARREHRGPAVGDTAEAPLVFWGADRWISSIGELVSVDT